MKFQNALLGCFLFFFFTINSNAQLAPETPLYKTIMAKDSLLFQIGFNTCNVVQFESLLSDSFEFFHDRDGIADKKKFMSDFRKGLCNPANTFQARRELVPESTAIYALYENGTLYGAVQEGWHQFYEKQPDQAERFGSSAKFTHVWLLENGEWKLARSLSFEHQLKQLSVTKSPMLGDDDAVKIWLKAHKVPLLGVGVIEKGVLKEIKTYGEIAEGIPASPNTIFNVASLTKPVTAMVALKLVSLGKWKLDDPLYPYWTDPEIAKDPRHKKITTRLILSHQTGFPNWRWMSEDKKLAFQFDPGTDYQYSGEGYEYLRKALERKFKKTLQELAKELLFEPLEMKDTRYIWDKKIDTTRLAIGFDQNKKPYPIVKNKTPSGADDLMTTIADYGKFLIAVMNGDGLSAAVFKEMSTPQVESTNGKHFGLGFERYDFEDGDYALSHGGADHGVRTLVFIFPKTGQGLLIFTNSDEGGAVYEKVVLHYLGEKGKQIVEIETR